LAIGFVGSRQTERGKSARAAKILLLQRAARQDFAPTVLDLFGVARPGWMDGHALRT
jgi:bisphosphoglycerate-independent phosphoglycerate mutase (AlkP superfamily)